MCYIRKPGETVPFSREGGGGGVTDGRLVEVCTFLMEGIFGVDIESSFSWEYFRFI
jgi:hypothetical protein